MGGFFCGAEMPAGHPIALAIDVDKPVVNRTCVNHPRGDAPRHEARPATDDWLISSLRRQRISARWHLHMSPPCQALSKLQQCNKPEHRRSFTDGMARSTVPAHGDALAAPLVVVEEALHGARGCAQLPQRRPGLCVDFAKVDLVTTASVRPAHACWQDARHRTTLHQRRLPTSPRAKPVRGRHRAGGRRPRASVGKNPDPVTIKHADGTYTNNSPGSPWLLPGACPAPTCTASTSAHAFLAADFHTLRSFIPEEDALLQTRSPRPTGFSHQGSHAFSSGAL